MFDDSFRIDNWEKFGVMRRPPVADPILIRPKDGHARVHSGVTATLLASLAFPLPPSSSFPPICCYCRSRMQRCAVLATREFAADYERVRRYYSSRIHARAWQYRGAGQSRRWHGPAVPEGPSRQPGGYVSRQGECAFYLEVKVNREIIVASPRSACCSFSFSPINWVIPLRKIWRSSTANIRFDQAKVYFLKLYSSRSSRR